MYNELPVAVACHRHHSYAVPVTDDSSADDRNSVGCCDVVAPCLH